MFFKMAHHFPSLSAEDGGFSPCQSLVLVIICFFVGCFLSRYEVGVVLISVSLMMFPMALNTLKIKNMFNGCLHISGRISSHVFSFGVLGIEPKAWHTPSKGSIASHTSNATSSSFFLLSPFSSLVLLLHRDST